VTYGETYHVPVLLEEILERLDIQSDAYYCDATLGGGGYTRQLMKRLNRGKVIAFDRDPSAIAHARDMLGEDPRYELVHANFSHMEEQWTAGGWPAPLGIMYDLGLSSIQLEDPGRGFSFQADAPLDMRYDTTDASAPTAADIVNTAAEQDLVRMFFEHGEGKARRIARRIAAERERAPVETTNRLAGIVASATGSARGHTGRHPATKVFMALRMVVNREAESLVSSLNQALRVVAVGGRIAVVSYQSREDAIVKNLFRRAARGCRCQQPPDECQCAFPATGKLVNKRVLVPAEKEIADNPRSRSARLRIIERI